MAEIAGLVLAVVPLLISALEHYEDAVDPVVAFFRWRQRLPKVIRELYMENAAYAQNIRLLLNQTTSDAELSDMINNPNCDNWKSADLEDALRDQLGTAYEPCMSTVNEIAEIMVTIAKCLNIKGTDKVTQQGLEAIVFANPPTLNATRFRTKFCFRERIDFTMNRRAAATLLGKLGKCNTRLSEFIDKADKIQGKIQDEVPGSRAKIKFVAPLTCIRGNASKVYGALSRSWCTTHSTHHAGLRLEQRLVRRGRKNRKRLPQEIGGSDCFGISLLRISKLSWVDTEFRVDDDDAQLPRYGDGASHYKPRVPAVTFSLLDAPIDPPPQLQLPEVTDICFAIESAAHPLVGLRLCSSGTLRGLYEVKSPPCKLSAECVALCDFLLATKREDFSLSDLYMLAITLVSSILQLSETPWLQQPWSKQNIQFLRLRGNCDDSVDIRHPYLTQGGPETVPSDQRQQVDSRNMLALAIMLLEIQSGTPIESVRQGEEADLTTAKRWLDMRLETGRLTWQFAGAITSCLQCYLDPSASFSNPDFLRAVEEKVLGPLESEMQYLYGHL
ncbi:hypothetical protein B0T25DRAFT_488810 [Lasiosphaeria hispida]|uniref:DUF7580 domain-containing protein n=1 Tax=Lasiosphaeria hispida TaxID=260671 RepID=A0AAJ0H758_9PEZI|nr:hypothetical protein B0T25DRAFT_488810 [Lasiosphaeria hispida]